MPLTALQAISLAAVATLDNQSNLRFLSETPNDAACTSGGIKESFGGGKWIKYQCVDGKGTKLEYEIAHPQISEDEVLADLPQDPDWVQKTFEQKNKRDMKQREAHLRDLFRQRQRDKMQKRSWITVNKHEEHGEARRNRGNCTKP